MNIHFLKSNAAQLKAFSQETELRAAARPSDWLLAAAAKNQRDAAIDAENKLLEAEGEQVAQALEWRLVGTRLNKGRVPLGLLARLSDPLNKLLLRAAYFARNNEEPSQGTGEDFAQEIDLKLAAIAEGSARLFIVGNTTPDMAGSAALLDGIKHLFATLESADESNTFYEALGELGEMAADSLHDALKALELEECSLEMRWHGFGHVQSKSLRFDEIVRMRVLLESTLAPDEGIDEIIGMVSLLASTGRLQILQGNGEKVTIRFKPKTQGDYVAALRLGQHLSVRTSYRIFRDPVSGEESRFYRLITDSLH